MIIDVSVPGYRNLVKKEAEKILKYTDLIIEIQCTWNLKAKVIPVINGATGSISKSQIKYLSNVPGKRDVQELNKTATYGTAHFAESAAVLYKSVSWEIALHVPHIVTKNSCNGTYRRNMNFFDCMTVNILQRGAK